MALLSTDDGDVTITNKVYDVIVTVSSDYFKITDNKPLVHVEMAIIASLQFCFWFGDNSMRPINSFKLGQIVQNELKGISVNELHTAKDKIIAALMLTDITMIEERIDCLNQVFKLDFVKYSKLWDDPIGSMNMLMTIPTFKRDYYKKKALLAIKESGKRTGIISNMDIPADYRIPQVLNYLGILEYSSTLANLISNDVFIPENSKLEIEIRAKAISACRIIAEENNITPHQVDDYLFGLIRQCDNKHHLTLTTNY